MTDLGKTVVKGGNIQMLGGGNPASIPEVELCLREEMERLLGDGGRFETMIGHYDSPRGNQRFIEALASLFNEEFGWPVEIRNIAITNGSQASFGILFNLFAGEFPDGSIKKILLPMTPEYIGYGDVSLSDHPLFIANRPVIEDHVGDKLFFKYRVDFEKLVVNEEIGAICVSRPTNPTGNVITDSEVHKLSELAAEAGIPLIIDSAYGVPFPGIIFRDAEPIWNDNTILCLSLSKLGLPGARTGIVIASEAITQYLCSANAIYNLAPGGFGPTLINRLVESRELLPLCRQVIKPYYRQRSNEVVKYIREIMSDLPVRIHLSEGAIFLWLWIENLPITGETLYQKLKKRGVFVVAGHHFFPGLQEDWEHKHQCIRVSYAADPAQIREGIKIIAHEIRETYHRAFS